ncbi:hypothetical protein HNR39_000548 [Glaciimonas immobilis]|uniref:Uncharacterized protein n=1 Tax=Glaciimonas immobilis TaxID=728004 RepID=A0A840RP67_9BURK|nr:hypothetical protein [Glaciimonas immobilis]
MSNIVTSCSSNVRVNNNIMATYDPAQLLDAVIQKLHLKNDAALSRSLEISPPIISKIRHRRFGSNPRGDRLIYIPVASTLR